MKALGLLIVFMMTSAVAAESSAPADRVDQLIGDSELRFDDLAASRTEVDDWIGRLNQETRVMLLAALAEYPRGEYDLAWEDPRSRSLHLAPKSESDPTLSFPALESIVNDDIAYFVRFTVARHDQPAEAQVMIGFDSSMGGRVLYVVTRSRFTRRLTKLGDREATAAVSTDVASSASVKDLTPARVHAWPLITTRSSLNVRGRVRAGCARLLTRWRKPGQP